MRIFSGIRPSSGQLHLGNYLGAVKKWVDLQENHDCIYSIVDLHAITTPYDPDTLKEKAREVFASYLALGVDSEKSIIFIQSHIKEHAELAWLLSTITPVGKLKRMTQYKEKSKKHPKKVNAGLLNYPVLMAADILLYKAEKIPVGEDQFEHVELTRDIAKKFNNKFGDTFPLPEPLEGQKESLRIMSLSNPENKMSKSDKDSSWISPFEKSKNIKEKIMSAQTDTGNEIKYDPEEKPGISNLISIFSLFSNLSKKEVEDEFPSGSYKEFKESLADLLMEKLKPFREKKQKLNKNSEFLDKKIKEGQKQAKKRAQENIREIKKKMGF